MTQHRPARHRPGQPPRPRFVLTLEAAPDRDPVHALRALLKVALRRFGLRCTDARELRLDVVTSAR
jgi:hypothetical protein